MKIKIGTAHVEEGEFTERHTEYPRDFRKYRQAAQDVPLYVSFYLFSPPMPAWAIAEWPIYVHKSRTTRREEEEGDITAIETQYWTKKRRRIGVAALDKYVKWTPDVDFPEPELLISDSSNEWVKKYTPTLKLLYSFSARHDQEFTKELRDKANAYLDSGYALSKNSEYLYAEYVRLLSQVYATPNPQDRIQVEIVLNHYYSTIPLTSCNDVHEFQKMDYELHALLHSEQVKECGYCNELYCTEDGIIDVHDCYGLIIDYATEFCSLICSEDYEMKMKDQWGWEEEEF